MAEVHAKDLYSEELKKQMLDMYDAGKMGAEIMRKYKLSQTTLEQVDDSFDKGEKQMSANEQLEHLELLKLRKENERLKMENNVLKHALIIFARK